MTNVTPEDREQLAKAGHRHGIVRSLVDFWTREGSAAEPTYSIAALVALHYLALGGAEKALWESAARALEGERGAARTSRMNREARRASSRVGNVNERVDDQAEPEAAPDTSGDSGIDEDDTSHDAEVTASEPTDEPPSSEEAEDAEE